MRRQPWISSVGFMFPKRAMFGTKRHGKTPPFPKVSPTRMPSITAMLAYSSTTSQRKAEPSVGLSWLRNISLDRVFIFNASGTPVGETINRNQFNTYFAQPFLEMLQNRSSSSGLNYLVTTKGVPLRVSGGNDKASFDQEIALLGGTYNSSIGTNWWFDHTYGPLAGKAMEPFTRSEYGFFLVRA